MEIKSDLTFRLVTVDSLGKFTVTVKLDKNNVPLEAQLWNIGSNTLGSPDLTVDLQDRNMINLISAIVQIKRYIDDGKSI